jgi:hypothetical protein
MAAFEDNNPFASPASPTSSRANSYAPFGYNYSPTSQPTHNPNLSFGSTVDNNRPQTSSSEDAPAYLYRATNSDFSVDPQPSSNLEGVSGVTGPAREKEGETCCKIDEIILKNAEMRIVISDAGKASDGGANFIAYTIEVGVGYSVCGVLILGIDFTKTVFRVCFTERGPRTVVSNFDYSAYP